MSAVAIGDQSGVTSQSTQAVAIGISAGNTGQTAWATAIGYYAGQTAQGTQGVAIGYQAGNTSQKSGSVALGINAGQLSQGSSSIAIGSSAGQSTQGSQAIAIGLYAGQTSQHNNTIILNASGVALNSAQATSCYIAPVRVTAETSNCMFYSSAGEVTQANAILYNVSTPSLTFFLGTAVQFTFTTSGQATQNSNSPNWAVVSDERKKQNIELANITMCYNNVKSLPLKRYQYRPEVNTSSKDNTRTGWIAQDVQNIYPKAVSLADDGYLCLNVDEIYAAMYGAVQKLIEKSEDVKSYSGRSTIVEPAAEATVSVPVPFDNTAIVQVTPIFNGTSRRTLNVSEFDPVSGTFSVHGTSGDFFWSITKNGSCT